MLSIFSLEILKKKTTNYVSLHFPPPPVLEDEDDFPPPPPDALGLPPKKSLGSLEEIEVFVDFIHKIFTTWLNVTVTKLSNPITCQHAPYLN